MVLIRFMKEEKKLIDRTYQKFVIEDLKISLTGVGWMTMERSRQFSLLHECLKKTKNRQFIAESLVDSEEIDNFSKMAQWDLANETMLDERFIILLSGQSLTNRIIDACKNKKIHPGLVYRLKQCICVYQLLVRGFDDGEHD